MLFTYHWFSSRLLDKSEDRWEIYQEAEDYNSKRCRIESD